MAQASLYFRGSPGIPVGLEVIRLYILEYEVCYKFFWNCIR